MAMEMGDEKARDAYERCKLLKGTEVAQASKASDLIMDFASLKRVRELGRGGFGVVDLMEDENEKRIAVKCFQVDGGIDSQRIVGEIEALVILKHPSILEIIGWCLPTGDCQQARLATEFMSNGSVEDALKLCRSGNPPDFWTHENIAKIIVGVLHGMKYMHSQSIIHRGVRPSNLFLDESIRVRIGDFGTARFEDCGSKSVSDVGRICYMAPEAASGDVPTKAFDVFSFGLILYELLTGESVFPRSGNRLQIATMQAEGIRPEIPNWIHPLIAEIIRKCWSGNPTERPTFEWIYDCLKQNLFPFFHDVSGGLITGFADELDRLASE
jgi:serine/threonine protein kinase